MKNLREKQICSEVPSILSKYLELPQSAIQIKCDNNNKWDLKVRDKVFLVEFKESSAIASLFGATRNIQQKLIFHKNKNLQPLIVVPYMGEKGRLFLEKEGISWLDLSGNVNIRMPGAYIRVEGRPNSFKQAGRPANVFAPKSSRIARQLLINPERRFTQREIAKETGLDEGLVSRVVKRIENDGLISRDKDGKIYVSNPDRLLDAWHEVYDFQSHSVTKGFMAARSGEELLKRVAAELSNEKIYYAITGLGAAWLYDRFASFRLLTVYVDRTPDLKGFRQEESGANLWLVVPNDTGVCAGASMKDGIRCVHPVQAHLDLKAQPERAEEAAENLRRNYLKYEND